VTEEPAAANKKLTILVSSTVYDYEELLDRIYTLLTQFGYEVWMSHKGTMPVFSDRSAFENCLAATKKCDLFLGLITPRYGSGVDKGALSITHQELKKAIELKKPRWLLAHDHVIFARSLLNNLGYQGKTGREKLTLEKNQIMDDLRVIDMYEDAIVSRKPLQDRQGNWVQKFSSDADATLFATAQFSRYQEVEEFLKENFRDSTHVSRILRDNGGRS
jgi:hypothetical protein